MLSLLGTLGRLLLARWPLLLAWFLAGWLARYLLIELAAWVGVHTTLGAFLILPLAVLARMVSFVMMFLALRDGMPGFQSAVAAPAAPAELAPGAAPGAPRGTVSQVVLSALLPFFVFYAAWKLLGEDVLQYSLSALEKLHSTREFFDGTSARTDNILDLQLGWAPITAIAVAFAGRMLLKRFAARLPRWTTLVAVYLEAVWVYLTLLFVSDYLDQVQAWVDGRAALHWVAELRAVVGEHLAPLAWIWDGIAWAVAEAGAVVLLPLAWLTLAGVVFGRAIAQQRVELRLRGRLATTARTRFGAAPAWLQRRARDVGDELTARWRPLANALLLMWRAGAVPMGVFVLLYTVVEAGRYWLLLAGVQLVGPHPLATFWTSFEVVVVFVVDALVEPIRICLVAVAYDYSLRRLEERRRAAEVGAAAQVDGVPISEAPISGAERS